MVGKRPERKERGSANENCIYVTGSDTADIALLLYRTRMPSGNQTTNRKAAFARNGGRGMLS